MTDSGDNVFSDIPANLREAHKHSSRHWQDIMSGGMCGCFCCLKTFDPQLIETWTDEGGTALCPFCGVDSVIGDRSGFPITYEFLAEMKKHWFEVPPSRQTEQDD